MINTLGLKQLSPRLRSFTVRSVCFLLKSFFLSFPSPKFPMCSADTPPTHIHTNTHSQRLCRLLTDVWRESRKILSQTKNRCLLVCTESVKNRRYACNNEKLARIPRHGIVLCIYSVCCGCRCVPRVGYRSVSIAPALLSMPFLVSKLAHGGMFNIRALYLI